MIDFLLGLFFAALALRGWARGLVKEALDLAGMVAGIILAFRLGRSTGSLIGELTGVSPEVATLAGGVLIFGLVGMAAAIASSYLHRVVSLPGLNLSNRVGGAALALAWGLFLATLLLSLLIILPLPQAVAGQVERSTVARVLTDPEATPQEAFRSLAGERMVESLINLRRLVGGRRVILQEGESITFAPAQQAELVARPDEAAQVFELLNRARLEGGLEPLAWSVALAAVGEAHAWEMYTTGYFAHQSPFTGSPADRVRAAGIPYSITGENLAMATTAEAAHEGLMESPGHRDNILHPAFRRVGIGVVEGPLGLMVVQVFTG